MHYEYLDVDDSVPFLEEMSFLRTGAKLANGSSCLPPKDLAFANGLENNLLLVAPTPIVNVLVSL